MSEVGGNSPSRLVRLEKAESAMIAATKGAKAMKRWPIFSDTSLLTFSTAHSATSWRLVPGLTDRPWVRYRHRPRMEIMTAQEVIWEAVMVRSISGMGMVR